jgi:hypothetical protein
MAQVYNYQNIILAGTVMNGTINSKAMQLQNSMFYNIQIVFTGTPTGSFKLQASSDNSATMTAAGQFPYQPVNWTDVPDSSTAVSAAGSVMWNIEWASYNFVRVVYTDTSGGTSTAVITVSTMNVKG